MEDKIATYSKFRVKRQFHQQFLYMGFERKKNLCFSSCVRLSYLHIPQKHDTLLTTYALLLDILP